MVNQITEELETRKNEFLGKVHVNFKRARVAYNNYMNEGKIFIHASILKECNFIIRDLLLENAHILSEELINDSIDLISHYDIWFAKWNELKLKNNPGLNDFFIFESEYSFPKSAEKRLTEEYLKGKRIS